MKFLKSQVLNYMKKHPEVYSQYDLENVEGTDCPDAGVADNGEAFIWKFVVQDWIGDLREMECEVVSYLELISGVVSHDPMDERLEEEHNEWASL